MPRITDGVVKEESTSLSDEFNVRPVQRGYGHVSWRDKGPNPRTAGVSTGRNPDRTVRRWLRC